MIDYLLQFYLKLTPNIIDERQQLRVTNDDHLDQKQIEMKVQMEKFFKKMAY